MRKIAANYILLPGFEFVRRYVVLKSGKVVDVVNTGGEIGNPCLESTGE